ncbi:hypothetical protein V8J88_03390 [Massilia sp. W12]|uniref:hypothetical protein n=1 Tax=Massilia sp. W12 TaxID=3126507 RepID=UPI0030D0F3C2
MRLGRAVHWETVVLPAWRRAACSSEDANADVWRHLPPDCCWLQGEIETPDIEKMFIIGSQDWFDVFGAYQLGHIAQRIQADRAAQAPDDIWQHHSHVQYLYDSYCRQSRPAQPLMLAAADARGPFVLLDGNHRALALYLLRQLVGQPCFVALHASMEQDFLWMRRALSALS